MASLADNVARVIKTFGDIKTAIIERGVSVENNTPVEEYPDKIRDVSLTNYNQGLADGLSSGEADGRQAQYDEFWDTFQQKGKRTDYGFLFAGSTNKDWFKPKYDLKPTTLYMFTYFGALDLVDFVEWFNELGITLDTSNCRKFQYAFGSGARFGVIDTTATDDLATQVFNGNGALHTIDELIVKETTKFNIYTFGSCVKLANIKITGTIGNSITFHASPLVKDSILSVFNALSTTVTDKTLTLKKSAVNKAFGINVDDTSTYTDEWKSLTESKKNWNIAYA